MKKGILTVGYACFLATAIFLQSCQDDPILPNDPNENDADTVWVDDSSNVNDPNCPIDSTGNDYDDSTDWNGGGDFGDSTDWGNQDDSTFWGDPNDSTTWGGGN
jgi:hypothetical protein